MQNPYAGHIHDQHARERNDHDGTEVWLQQDRKRHHPDEYGRPEGSSAEQLDAPAGHVQPDGKQYHNRDLGELAGLKPQRTEHYPTVRSVDWPEAEYRPQQKKHDYAEKRRQRPVFAPVPVVEPCREHGKADTHAEVEELALHEMVGVAMQTHGVRLACA